MENQKTEQIKIIGRERECRKLTECMQSKRSELVIVYGRRRVGKTFLVNNFFHRRFDFKMTGAFEQPMDVQLKNFSKELSLQSKNEFEKPTDWFDAFELLKVYLKSLPKNEKHVIFFDEMPWLDTQKSNFVPAFEWFWNDWCSNQDNLVFIVCGSATAWMVDNIAENKGGLFNRQTCRIYLEPFSLHETELYLQEKNIIWSRYDIAEMYMILGGIPYYWSMIEKELSPSANIDNLFFRKRAVLWDEFEHLYHTLFSNSAQYIKVVAALSEKKIGMTRNEISEKTKLPANGALSRILENLASSGFVRAYRFFGNKKANTFYQLSDFYTMFYFRFIKDGYGRDEHFWSNSLESPARKIWAGITFEQLCKDHAKQIKKRLGISGVRSEESAYLVRANDVSPGAQIDMIIDRNDRIINICEMKFSINEFIIDKEYDAALRNKIDVFRNATKTKKALQLTMITTRGVYENIYSSIAQSRVLLDDLFETVDE